MSNPLRLGIIYSVVASIFFAIMPAYLQLLPEMSGYAVAGQRIIWTSLFISGILLLRSELITALKPLTQVKQWPGLITGALLVGIQWLIFVWAPLNAETLSLSLGYFLLPLTLVLVGRFLYNEQLHHLQWLAIVWATLAVANSLWHTGQFSWVALVIALGYPLYFILRRKQAIPIMSAFLIENLLLLPLAWWACQHYGQVEHAFAYSWDNLLLFFGVGILGSLGMLCMLTASRQLPVALFGLLGYLEPPLIMLVGIAFLGEQINTDEFLSYVFIVLALITLVIHGLRNLQRARKRLLNSPA